VGLERPLGFFAIFKRPTGSNLVIAFSIDPEQPTAVPIPPIRDASDKRPFAFEYFDHPVT
jgi:hypothetical protein